MVLDSVPSSGESGARPEAESADLFDASSYSDWVRGAVRLRETDPDVAILFESSIAEPTDLLMDVVREAFSPEVTSRYVSVFADGNRYALTALARRYGLPTEQIITTTGATGALVLVLKTLMGPGDHVLVESPGFDFFSKLALESGATVDTVSRPAPSFGIDLDDLRRKLTPRTRAILITNLHNPSGAELTAEAITAAAAVADQTGAVLVVDEVYADFSPTARPAARLAPNVISVSSLTKVMGLFALKFGWLAAHPDLIARIRLGAPDGDIGVSKLSHAVAALVLEAPERFEGHWRAALAAARPLVSRHATSMRAAGLVEGDVPPHGCMYFPRIVGVDDTLALARRLYHRHRVLVAPGEYFGAPGHLRIGFGAGGRTIAAGLERLESALRAERG